MQLTTPPPPPTLASVPAESSAPVRKAVLAGCGGIARQWLKAAAALDDVEVVGLCDVRPQQMAEIAAAHGLGAVSTGEWLAEVIGASGADTVFDCTVPGAHHDITVAALAAGCDVLGEKRMAETMGDAQAMVRTAADAGKSYAVIPNRRYTPQIVTYRRALQNPALGGLTGLHADFFDGLRTEMRHVLLLDMAIHSFDQARVLTGADPMAVTAIDWNPRGSWFGHGGNAVAVFEMTGGLVFSYRGSWCSEGQHTSWSARGAEQASEERCRGMAAIRLRENGRRGPRREAPVSFTPPSRGTRRDRSISNTPATRASCASSSTAWPAATRHRPTAATTSRAWRWCSARWRVLRPAAGASYARRIRA